MGSTPMAVEDAVASCGIDEISVKKEIDLLRARNLLFEEGKRYISLVIEEG